MVGQHGHYQGDGNYPHQVHLPGAELPEAGLCIYTTNGLHGDSSGVLPLGVDFQLTAKLVPRNGHPTATSPEWEITASGQGVI